MRKVRVYYEERTRTTGDFIIEVSDDVTDNDLNRILSTIERQAKSSSDVLYLASKLGINVLVYPSGSLESPDYSEIEITEYEEIE